MNNESIEKWREEQLKKCLLPMQEDITDWIHQIFESFTKRKPKQNLAPDTIFYDLSNGQILCKFANLIIGWLEKNEKNNATNFGSERYSSKINLKTAINGIPRPLTYNYSDSNNLKHMQKMENIHNFLKFCRDLGIFEILLFESNDLVNYQDSDLKQQRQVLITLLELARILQIKFGFTNIPELLKLEMDIESSQQKNGEGLGDFKNVNDRLERSQPRPKSTQIVSRNKTAQVRFQMKPRCQSVFTSRIPARYNNVSNQLREPRPSLSINHNEIPTTIKTNLNNNSSYNHNTDKKSIFHYNKLSSQQTKKLDNEIQKILESTAFG